MKLRFSEEIVLVLLDQDAGGILRIAERDLGLVLAGATLMDLALEDRIDTDLEQVILLDPAPLNDSLLDPALAEIARSSTGPDSTSPDSMSIPHWLARIAESANAIRTKALDRLVASHILESAEDGFQFLRSEVERTRLYPVVDGKAEEEVMLRVMRVLFSDDIPEPRDIVIISLLNGCRQFETLLDEVEYEKIRERLDLITSYDLIQVRERIELISRMDHIGRTVAEAIRKVSAQDTPERTEIKFPIPVAKGLPVLGNALELQNDIHGFILRRYRELGSVFETRILNRKFIVLAGVEANEFANRHGDTCLSMIYTSFSQALGSRRSLAGMSGGEHSRMRRSLGRGYSRTALEGALAKALSVIRGEISQWKQGELIWPRKAMQRMTFQQVATVTSGQTGIEHMNEIVFFLKTIFHKISTNIPFDKFHPIRMKRAQKELDTLYHKMLRQHGHRQPSVADRNLMDMVVGLHRTDPAFMPECDLKDAIVTPFIAGVDTVGNTMSFLLYEVLKNPDLLAQIREEVDTVLADGIDAVALRKLDVTRRTVLEANRLRPVAPMLLRTVVNSFEFAGYQIPVGANVAVASGVTHFLPEFFPEPERFDIERYLPDRAEDKQRLAYVPYGLGHHRCLGAGMAEPLLVLTLATLVRETELEMAPKDYDLRVSCAPVPTPSSKFRVRYLGPRHA